MVTNAESNGKISTINVSNDGPAEEVADIEKATRATGYGSFNVLLLLAALPIGWTGIFDTTTTAFILASAECDLGLDFLRKGVLAASPFLGMTATGFVWDHLAPHIATRNLFIIGLLADSLLNIVASSVESYHAFLAVKILSGVLAGGPFSMVLPYLSEFHSAMFRPSFARWAGLALNAAIVVPAMAAFTILPMPLAVDVFDRRYSSWRIYLLVCSIVPVIGLVTATTLPHTPKYLLEIGKPDEALALLRRMYSMNKRKPAGTFPIRALLVRDNAPLSRRSSSFKANLDKLRLAGYNAKLLFSPPYLRAIAFLGFLQFGSMLGFNTMRLWVPHLFIVLSNFDKENWTMDRPPTMSEMLDRRMTAPSITEYSSFPDFEYVCAKWKINAVVYQNSAIIALSTVVASFLAGILFTTKFRKRAILLAALLLSVVSSFGMNWAQIPPYMLTLAAAIIVTTRIAGNVVTAVNADVIPIPLRSSSLNLLTVVGNAAAVLGNVAFSALLDVDCLIAFMGMATLLLACFCLSFFHPEPVKRTTEKNLASSEP